MHLPSTAVVAQQLQRTQTAVSPAGLPRLHPEQLVGLARDAGRWADLERVWQRVSLKRAAALGAGTRARCLVSIDPVAFEGERWTPSSLGRVAEELRLDPATVVLEIDLRDRRLDVGATSRLASGLRRAGFRVGVRVPERVPSPWRVAQPHWLILGTEDVDLAVALAAEARARGSKLLVTDVSELEVALALREAGVPYASGAALGPARDAGPGGVARSVAAALRARGLRRRYSETA